MGSQRGVGIVAGLVAALGFATSGPMVKPLLEAGWSPGGAILARLTIGGVLLAGPSAWVLRGRWHVLRDGWRTVVGFGVVGIAGASTLFFFAVDRLPVAVALLIEYTGPLLLVLWRWATSRRAPSRGTLVGAALTMGGLVLVLDVAGSLHLDGWGLLAAVGASVGNAAYFAFTGRPTPVPPVALAGVGMLVGAATVGLAALVGILPVAAPRVGTDLVGHVVPWYVPLAIVAVVPTAFAFGVSAVSVRLLGERVASFVALAEVVFAVFLAWALVGEAPLVGQLAGMVLVVAGIATVRRAGDQAPTRAEVAPGVVVGAGPVVGPGPVVTAGPVVGPGPVVMQGAEASAPVAG